MKRPQLTPYPAPTEGLAGLDLDWAGSWLRETHERGRRRVRAIGQLGGQLQAWGVLGLALVGGSWLDGGSAPGIWRRGPHQGRMAEGAGALPEAWMWAAAEALLSRPEADLRARTEPLGWRVEGPDAGSFGVLLDLAVEGRRPAVVLLRFAADWSEAIDELATRAESRWVMLGIAAMLRGDLFRLHWEQLGARLVWQPPSPWGLLNDLAERPVNAQEVVQRAAELAAAHARGAADAFQVATVGIFMPDPDDEYVWALGAAGGRVHAYDAGLVQGKPEGTGVGFGLTASYAVSPTWDPAGSPVQVRSLARREELLARYRELGFDDEQLDEEGPTGPFAADHFLAPEAAQAARQGPWVFCTQRLPRSLSPTGRNLVVRFAGRTLDTDWASPEELARTRRDRRSRMASLTLRIHGDLSRLFAEGLTLWRDGMRDELLRELAAGPRWGSICQSLASWLSARCISLWELEHGVLSLTAWSLASRPPRLSFEVGQEQLDSRELRLLQAPLHPPRSRVSSDGFLGWAGFEEALGGAAENVGTVPIQARGETLGLLRVDGGMGLFGGLLARRHPHGALHLHRPLVTPAHLRPALEEAARLMALTLARPAPQATRTAGWTRWVGQVCRGVVGEEEARARLSELRSQHPTRQSAAAAVGVHRNTFRRQLQALADVVGEEAVRW